MMKLYYTATSPYARLVRIVIIEKGLEDGVRVLVAGGRLRDAFVREHELRDAAEEVLPPRVARQVFGLRHVRLPPGL